jgi:hypothetical protein
LQVIVRDNNVDQALKAFEEGSFSAKASSGDETPQRL